MRSISESIHIGSDSPSMCRRPFSRFTESQQVPLERVARIITNQSPKLGTPISAGWPRVFIEGIPNCNVIGFDINTFQLNRFISINSFPDGQLKLYLADICDPNLQLFCDLANCDYIFMSNIADWVYKGLGTAGATFFDTQGNIVSNATDTLQIDSFNDSVFAMLTNGNIGKRMLFSSLDMSVLEQLLDELNQRAALQGYEIDSMKWSSDTNSHGSHYSWDVRINDYLEVWVG